MGDTQLENGHRGRQQCGVLMWGNPEQTAIAKNCIRSHWVFLFGCLRAGIVFLEETTRLQE